MGEEVEGVVSGGRLSSLSGPMGVSLKLRLGFSYGGSSRDLGLV